MALTCSTFACGTFWGSQSQDFWLCELLKARGKSKIFPLRGPWKAEKKLFPKKRTRLGKLFNLTTRIGRGSHGVITP